MPNPPGLPRETIEAYIVAFEVDTGTRLSYPEAAIQAQQIFEVVKIISRPIPTSKYLLCLERLAEVKKRLDPDAVSQESHP